jgi:hypothetical protein
MPSCSPLSLPRPTSSPLPSAQEAVWTISCPKKTTALPEYFYHHHHENRSHSEDKRQAVDLGQMRWLWSRTVNVTIGAKGARAECHVCRGGKHR